LDRLGVTYHACLDAAEAMDALDRAPAGEYSHFIYQQELCREISLSSVDAGWTAFISIRDYADSGQSCDTQAIDSIFRPLLATSVAKILNSTCDGDEDYMCEQRLGNFHVDGADVLIIDDNDINLLVASEILKQYGITADTAQSGADALKTLEKKKYDLIFMDHMMPGMDGIEASERIRANDDWRAKVPIVALTANAIVGMMDTFLSHGMNDFISKPIEIEKLNQILLKWLPSEKISTFPSGISKDTDEKAQ
jgi:CheY-like chemotaxis protein